MKNYEIIQDVVTRLTTNRILRTFFTVYLMAESEEEKSIISARFRKDASKLDVLNRTELFNEFAISFRKLPEFASDLLEKVKLEHKQVRAA
jgi:hypothetical protein